MKAWLALQEGPGAGRSHPLDPLRQTVLSVGRSSECDIVLSDGRASRHHADIRWDGRQWTVVDNRSTNGTYVNGLQVHGPYDLRVGDRITIGETTMVLREHVAQSPIEGPVPAHRPQPAPGQGPIAGAGERPRKAKAPPVDGGVPRSGAHTAAGVLFWLAQGLIAVAVVCLASGAFLPWLRVKGSLSQELGPLLQGITDAISYFVGGDSYFEFTQEISGLEGYGKLTLAVAGISLIAMIVDVFFYRKSVVPAIVYLLSALIAMGSMASDLSNFYRLYKEAETWSLLFGIQLADVIQVFDQFIDMTVTPLPGLPLTVVGLVLLLLGGVGRLVVAILDRFA
jgi:hypothetical protein